MVTPEPCGNTLDSQAAYRASTSCCSEDGLDGRFNARSTRSAGHLASWRITWALVKVEKKHDANMCQPLPTIFNIQLCSTLTFGNFWPCIPWIYLGIDLWWHGVSSHDRGNKITAQPPQHLSLQILQLCHQISNERSCACDRMWQVPRIAQQLKAQDFFWCLVPF